jgi:phosphodiester glycosidase
MRGGRYFAPMRRIDVVTRTPRWLSRVAAGLLVLSPLACATSGNEQPLGAWRHLQPGVEYARFELPNPPSIGPNRLHVVRVDPRMAPLDAFLATERDGERRTAGDWCRQERLAVAINMGMFAEDGLTNVGYLRSGSRTNNARWNGYRSVLGLGPKRAGAPPALWVDRDPPTSTAAPFDQYRVVVQNLRLIRFPGQNCWKADTRRWSEAAVGMDKRGRLLFMFTRRPLSMDEFNRAVLGLPLEVVQAMHVEGGPEASLSVHAAGVDLDLCGSYETDFREDDTNSAQWPIPNVLGVRRAR